MKKILLSTLLLLIFCSISKAQNFTPEVKARKLKEIAKDDFKVMSVTISNDTLTVISRADYLFYPTGKYKNITQYINRSKLEWYRSVDRFIYNDTADMTIYKLWRLDDSYLNFYYSLETLSMEIISGYITDTEVRFWNTIHTGMLKQDFLEKFFITPPVILSDKINYIQFISGLREISHVYAFNNNDTLQSILFDRGYNYR